MAVYGVKCTDLRNEAIKILGACFSYNQKIKDDKIFNNIISNIQGVLNSWGMRNFTLEGRIVVFKTLAVSKIVFLGQRVRENTKFSSLERQYSGNKT